MEKILFSHNNGIYKTIYYESPLGEGIARFLQDDIDQRNFRIVDRFLRDINKKSTVVRTAGLKHIENNKIEISFDRQDPKVYISSTLLSSILWAWAWALKEKLNPIEIDIDWQTETATVKHSPV